MSLAPNWWTSTGYLYGSMPSLSPENPERISTNVSQVWPRGWIPPVQSRTYPSADLYQNDMGTKELHGASLRQVDVPDFCKANCTMGGCSDPTSEVHEACVAAGCCRGFDIAVEQPVTYSSQINYLSTDCVLGPRAFCTSDLAYHQCNPASPRGPNHDSRCKGITPQPTPWAAI